MSDVPVANRGNKDRKRARKRESCSENAPAGCKDSGYDEDHTKNNERHEDVSFIDVSSGVVIILARVVGIAVPFRHRLAVGSERHVAIPLTALRDAFLFRRHGINDLLLWAKSIPRRLFVRQGEGVVYEEVRDDSDGEHKGPLQEPWLSFVLVLFHRDMTKL